ncbi:MAG: hypothetical protein V1495_05835 [Pseudomonadota bacterium]
MKAMYDFDLEMMERFRENPFSPGNEAGALLRSVRRIKDLRSIDRAGRALIPDGLHPVEIPLPDPKF